MKCKRLIRILLFISSSTLLFSFSFPQSRDTTVKSVESDIKQLQEQIKIAKQKSELAKQQEKSFLRQMESINQRIQVRNKEMELIQNQLKKNETQTQYLQKDLESAQNKLTQYQTYLAIRVSSVYKTSHTSPYQSLLAADFSSAIRRARYQRTLAFVDAKFVTSTRSQANQIRKHKFDLGELIRYDKIQQEEVSRSKSQYMNQQKEKSNLLAKVQTDKVTYDRMVRDLTAARDRMEKLLADLRIQGEQFPDAAYQGEGIAQARGKLAWPVNTGTIMYGPGQHQIPNIGVPIFSKGIGIKASSGTDVYSVHDGLVRYASWLEGSGNTIIIDHGQQYLTLYMHLADITVKKGQTVQRKQKIGSVGDTGSLEGPQLEFQIRKGTSSLDPQDWLPKR